MTPRSLPMLLALLLAPLAVPGGRLLAQGGGTVSGTVRSQLDTPIADAEVVLGERRATTDAQGAFRFDGVPSGTHQFLVRAVGYTAHRSRIAVSDREPTSLEIVLRSAVVLLPPIVVEGRRTGVYGTVADGTRQPAAGATVQLMGRGATTVRTDSLGRFSLPAAHGTDVMLRIFLPGHLEHLFSLTIPKDEGREVAVLLTPAPRTRESGRVAVWAFDNLSDRLRVNSDRRRLTREELARFGTVRLCDVPPVREVGPYPTVIVNGDMVLPEWDYCDWRADELELVEWYPNARRQDLTGTVLAATRTLSAGGRPSGARSAQRVLVIWERR